MKFTDMYSSNKTALIKTLKSMWCSNAFTDEQRKYSAQIGNLISNELFAPSNAMPLVQCMDRYESIEPNIRQEADEIVTLNTGQNLWSKVICPNDYLPYKHQYEAWKSVLSDKKSIVVKTGTGSGKTECFMLPLVKDLCDTNQSGEIQAIFLYPLNALMEDQKDRLQKLLDDTGVKFSVYNGNLPDSEPQGNSDREKNQKARIDEERKKYPNIIATREELRQTTPNIILTNPTMLEYMMLRNKDQILFEKTDADGNIVKRKSLRWIVIDEAHTFSGAGAAELAMLIRRVLDAFGQKASDVRFATSSATIGNGGDESENNTKLRKFISDITGVQLDDVVVIDGKRDYTSGILDNDIENYRRLLAQNDYMSLDKLVGNENNTIEERLSILDDLCERGLKAKVHFFYRVPNNGLRVKLEDYTDGIWNIKHIIPNNDNAPYLELYRCEHCGEYFAVGETLEGTNDKYKALSMNESDIFDFDASVDKRQRLIFSLTDKTISNDTKTGDFIVLINNDKYNIQQTQAAGWNIVMNTKGKCPHCHNALLGNDTKNNGSDDDNLELDKHASTFRVQAPFISRVLAPSILPHLKVAEENPAEKPHKGQQYISFVDSRQAAAKSTLQQNLEEERLWVYSRLFYKLNSMLSNLNTNRDNIKVQLQTLQAQKENAQKFGLDDKIYDPQIDALTANLLGIPYMTWYQVYEFLSRTKECEELCYQFINKTEGSDELDAEKDCVTPEAKMKYLQTVMLELLSKRPRVASSPETMGLFTTYYPKLEGITSLPSEVKSFNDKFNVNIDLAQWKNFIKIFLDNTVRSNQSVFIKDTDHYNNLDIFACQRFGTSKPARRSVFKPTIETNDNKPASAYILPLLLLGKLINPLAKSEELRTVVYNNKDDINKVINAMWRTLTEELSLLQPSESFKGGTWRIDGDGIPQYRLNVCDIAFKPYTTVYFCDSRIKGGLYPVIRPVETIFMGYAPYKINETPIKVEDSEEHWKPWPHSENETINEANLHEWAKENRKGLWNNGLWGETGVFSNRLDTIYSYPSIFVQAEHTAQIDKIISKQSQDKFKNQSINILACSTTMEMGVDLGNLELVMMSTIPPHPTNYKQRAGRSGRNDDNRSVCITLCSSDAIGLRTLSNPMEHLILRPMATPFVDMNSQQVIQRHANAYLLRKSGILRNGTDNNLNLMVCDFFTPFIFKPDRPGQNGHYQLIHKVSGNPIFPNSLLKVDDYSTSTWFYEFINYIEDNFDNYKDGLAKLLEDTCFYRANDDINVIWSSAQRCKESIERCYAELSDAVADINDAYIEELQNADPTMVIGSAVNTGYGYLLRHKYEEILSKNLLQYLSTNRFTPNANMPVDIIDFIKDIRNYNWTDFRFKNDNPSYPLHEALSQYAPGNTIVLENRTYVVRGIQYTGMFRRNYTFKKLYSNGSITKIAVSDKHKPTNLKTWPVSKSKELTLIEPTSFIPSINENYSREIKGAPYTQVNAQLIGVEEEWVLPSDTESLISMRNNRDCANAKILYYNEGKGYGYQFCTKCGKTIIENFPVSDKKATAGLEKMHDEKDSNDNPYHYMINRYSNGKKKKCPCTRKSILRNVILGGLIQTDYCEIKIRSDKNAAWVQCREDNEGLLTTLGILLSQNFTEYIGKDRNDVDFIIMPNGHLCIYDTNPGGSGYSNQLSDRLMMTEVLKRSKKLLESSVSKDALLDKWSVRYLDKVDCKMTLKWLTNAIEAMNRIPENIKNSLPDRNISVASMKSISDAITRCTTGDSILFVEDDYTRWLYNSDQSDELGWKQRINDIRHSDKPLTLGVLGNRSIDLPVIDILENGINDWAKGVYWSNNPLAENIIPIAYISGVLYFTNSKEYASLNYDWAKEALYQCRIDIDFELSPIDIQKIRKTENITKFTIGANDPKKINSNELWNLVYKDGTGAKRIINSFFEYCKDQTGDISIVYQDEHLKSVIGFVTTLQFIEQLTNRIGKSFELEFKNEMYWDSNTCRGIASNIGNSDLRNDMLNKMLDDWKNQHQNCTNTKCTTESPKKLPHWRVLEIVCGDKCLAIYPNGGFVNEWFFDANEAKRQHNYYDENTSSNTSIPLFRRNEIMYDVEIKTI